MIKFFCFTLTFLVCLQARSGDSINLEYQIHQASEVNGKVIRYISQQMKKNTFWCLPFFKTTKVMSKEEFHQLLCNDLPLKSSYSTAKAAQGSALIFSEIQEHGRFSDQTPRLILTYLYDNATPENRVAWYDNLLMEVFQARQNASRMSCKKGIVERFVTTLRYIMHDDEKYQKIVGHAENLQLYKTIRSTWNIGYEQHAKFIGKKLVEMGVTPFSDFYTVLHAYKAHMANQATPYLSVIKEQEINQDIENVLLNFNYINWVNLVHPWVSVAYDDILEAQLSHDSFDNSEINSARNRFYQSIESLGGITQNQVHAVQDLPGYYDLQTLEDLPDYHHDNHSDSSSIGLESNDFETQSPPPAYDLPYGHMEQYMEADLPMEQHSFPQETAPVWPNQYEDIINAERSEIVVQSSIEPIRNRATISSLPLAGPVNRPSSDTTHSTLRMATPSQEDFNDLDYSIFS